MGACLSSTKKTIKENEPTIQMILSSIGDLLNNHIEKGQQQTSEINENLKKVMVSCTPPDRNKLVEIAKMNEDLLQKHMVLKEECQNLGVRCSQLLPKKATYDIISEKVNVKV